MQKVFTAAHQTPKNHTALLAMPDADLSPRREGHQPPRTRDICDQCGGPISQRDDDRPESVTVRMAAYQKSTEPLIKFYSARNLLVRVPATGTPVQILERSLSALKNLAAS